ncbi:hypothetical protein [Nocardiopsis algeriensis]|uniref:Uncharacterized protein n=1 Tax=Nocardiopsis algeriensis TaxID=1478215 RepID=A0A841IN90_9ACTN|nr:hypothetical protein [Nocardiopsis algeriensis]MBB6120289.1 hypothetical protein [Nocardiopsis algeriensis]
MTRFLGFHIGSGFGLAFVLANSGPPLPPSVALVLRALAVAAFIAIIALTVFLGRRPAVQPGPDSPQTRFDGFFGAVVLVEAVLLFGGLQVLRLFDAPVQANVAWIALVVGAHFFPLARHWRSGSLMYAAAYISALGLLGLALVLVGVPEPVPFVSGVLPGVGMLAGILASLVVQSRNSRLSGGT